MVLEGKVTSVVHTYILKIKTIQMKLLTVDFCSSKLVQAFAV
jgi:hypothetical protein